VAPTAGLVLIGTMVGDLLRAPALTPRRRLAALLLLGVGLAVAGWLWNLDLPFNKTVWSASYILYAGGLGTIVLALFYLGADLSGKPWWTYPLVVFGANAIFAYVAPILVKVYLLQGWTWEGHLSLQQAYLGHLVSTLGQVNGGLVYTGTYIVGWWVILFYMYRKGLLLRV
jgi:predicted acyltransferase